MKRSIGSRFLLLIIALSLPWAGVKNSCAAASACDCRHSVSPQSEHSIPSCHANKHSEKSSKSHDNNHCCDSCTLGTPLSALSEPRPVVLARFEAEHRTLDVAGHSQTIFVVNTSYPSFACFLEHGQPAPPAGSLHNLSPPFPLV